MIDIMNHLSGTTPNIGMLKIVQALADQDIDGQPVSAIRRETPDTGAKTRQQVSGQVSGGQQEQLVRTTALQHAVESINDLLQNQQRTLEFSVDDETGQVVVRVMDAERKDVIRQIPSELALKLMTQVREGGALQ
jgi:flagellar protein FlaG